MARIRVTHPRFEGSWQGREFNDAVPAVGGWAVVNGSAIFYHNEVRVLGRHEGEYDPNHPGELEPDAYDRMSYKYEDHGRHLLHTGVE